MTPYTRFGTELFGVAFPAEGAIALIGHGVLQTYFRFGLVRWQSSVHHEWSSWSEVRF